MAYEIGTATDYKDLFLKLKTFITTANTLSAVTPGGGNVGGGDVTDVSADNAAPTETWTLTCIAESAGGGTFSVVGSVSGAQDDAVVGTPYDNDIVAFTINDGDPDFAEDDTFTFDVTKVMGEEIWEVLRYNSDYDTYGNYEMLLKGIGLAGTDEIYVGIQTYGRAALGYYNWKLQGYTGYAAGETFDNQPGAIASNIPRVLLWNSSIPYWFFANGRRIQVAAKVSGVYEHMYLGFYLPYGLPIQMSYPLLVGGSSTDGNTLYTAVANDHRAFWDPGNADTESTLLLYYNAWYHFNNFISETTKGSNRNVWPYQPGGIYSIGSTYAYNRWRELRGAIDSNPVLFPLILTSGSSQPSRNIYGEIQNCFAVALDVGLTSESVITINGDEYIVFQNIYRVNTYNFCAIKKE